jgi:hypothetical protein
MFHGVNKMFHGVDKYFDLWICWGDCNDLLIKLGKFKNTINVFLIKLPQRGFTK